MPLTFVKSWFYVPPKRGTLESMNTGLPRDFGARIRAAAAYSNVGLEDFANEMNTPGASYGTLRRYVEKEARPGPLSEAALVRRLAETSGLPEAFFYGQAEGQSDIAARLEIMDHKLDRVLSQLQARPADTTAEIQAVFDQMISRLGREVGLRGPRSRPNGDRPREAPPAAA